MQRGHHPPGAVVVRLLAQSTLCETVSPVVLACARKCGSPIEFALCFAMGTAARETSCRFV
jgi:hypothetical protein